MSNVMMMAQQENIVDNNTEMSMSMHRVSSLYVHNPYGRGDMVRLAGDKDSKMRKAAEGITITINNVDENDVNNAVATTQGHLNWAHQGLASPACSSTMSACGSISDEPRSDVSERRRRNKKPRKNRSAGLVGDNGERVSVCLDYLKGVCNRKRSRCKFAHPQLSLDTPTPAPQCCVAAPAQTRVCEVWALTGFCKFGARCRDYHPAVEEPITKVCAPATTVRMTTASREAARRLSGSWSDDGASDDSARPCTPPPAAMPVQQPAFMQSWWEVDALIMNITHYNFDATLKRLVGLLTCSQMSGLTVETLLPMLFGKAIENFERLAALLAIMCRNLCDLYPEAQRHDFQCQLLRLADRVLHLTPDGVEGDEQLMNMARKQRGTAAFLGELFKQNLVPSVRLQSALDYCTKRAASPTDDGNLYTELACMLLRIVGPAAQSVLDLDQTLKHLNEAVAMHQHRQQQMWMQQQPQY